MALATTCPACSTSFKVNPEQLKLRRGLVRCGMCQHVFSGVEFLRYVTDSRANSGYPATSDGRREADIEGDSVPASSSNRPDSDDPPTIFGDLKTAFFLPDTQFRSPDRGPANRSQDAQGGSTSSDETVAPAPPDYPVPREDGGDSATDESRREAGRAAGEARSEGNDDDIAEDLSIDSIIGRHAGVGEGAGNDDMDAEESGAADASVGHAKSVAGTNGDDGDDGDDVAGSGSGDTSDVDRAADDRVGDDRVGSDRVGDDDVGVDGDDEAGDDATGDRVSIAGSGTDDAMASAGPAGDRPRRNGRRRGRGKSRNRRLKGTDQGPDAPGSGQDHATGHAAGHAAGHAPDDMAQESADAYRRDDWSRSGNRTRHERGFDEADIQAPDTLPLDAESDSLRAPEDADQDSPADRADTDALVRALSGDRSPPRGRGARNQSLSSVSYDGENAIDYFGQSAKPTFDFDLPPRRVWLVAALLTLILFIQLLLGARELIAARVPVLRAPLSTLAAPFGLTVELPWNATSVSIRSFELVAASNQRSNSRYTMIMMLGNEARHAMQWPAIELTLTNSVGEILVRKVILPNQYITDAETLANGIAATSEKVVRVGFATDKINPVGYSALLFHP